MYARSKVFDHGEPWRLRSRSGKRQTMQGESVHCRLPDIEKDAKRMNRMLNSHQPTAKPVHFQQTKHHLCLNQPNIIVKITSIMNCQAKQAADKTVAHHQSAKLASFH